jgi:hypothetical protein
MSKGDYSGGSTIIRPGSGWFSYRPAKDTPAHHKGLANDPRDMKQKIADAAAKLEASQAAYDRGDWKGKPPSTTTKLRKSRKRKHKAK